MAPLFLDLAVIVIISTSSVNGYHFVDILMTVDQAEQYCVSTFGTHLATIRSQLDNDRAFDACQPRANDTTFACSIGLNDKSKERHSNRTGWTWFSGATVTYLNWQNEPYAVEPNDWSGFPNGEDCVILWKTWTDDSEHFVKAEMGSVDPARWDAFWNDVPCNRSTDQRINGSTYTQRFLCDETPALTDSHPSIVRTVPPTESHPSVTPTVPPTATPAVTITIIVDVENATNTTQVVKTIETVIRLYAAEAEYDLEVDVIASSKNTSRSVRVTVLVAHTPSNELASEIASDLGDAYGENNVHVSVSTAEGDDDDAETDKEPLISQMIFIVIVIIGVVVLLFIVCICACVRRKNRKNKKGTESDTGNHAHANTPYHDVVPASPRSATTPQGVQLPDAALSRSADDLFGAVMQPRTAGHTVEGPSGNENVVTMAVSSPGRAAPDDHERGEGEDDEHSDSMYNHVEETADVVTVGKSPGSMSETLQ